MLSDGSAVTFLDCRGLNSREFYIIGITAGHRICESSRDPEYVSLKKAKLTCKR